MKYRFFPLGDCAIVIELGEDMNMTTYQKVQCITSYLDVHPPEWMTEYIPAFSTITVFYDTINIFHHDRSTLPYDFVYKQLNQILSTFQAGMATKARIIDIPVCYGGEFGPDLETVASINQLTTDDVIQIHTSGDYLVYMIGFAPGFPYIGGMSEEIAAPRRESPRLTIPERSVGIAGKQTGIYPIETPGGWQLIGRTPIQLFRPEKNPPSLLKAGDKIHFRSISYKEYVELEAKE